MFSSPFLQKGATSHAAMKDEVELFHAHILQSHIVRGLFIIAHPEATSSVLFLVGHPNMYPSAEQRQLVFRVYPGHIRRSSLSDPSSRPFPFMPISGLNVHRYCSSYCPLYAWHRSPLTPDGCSNSFHLLLLCESATSSVRGTSCLWTVRSFPLKSWAE